MRQGKRKLERKKEEMQTMQRGYESYRRGENCETAVNKGHHNVGSHLLRCCGFFINVFTSLI